jgi:hypothetical protein
MDNFVALIRDTLASKNPVGTWRESKNIILTKGLKSIANEDGFKFQYLVNGTVIGFIATNRHVVYFHKNEEGLDEIGVVNTNNDTPVYVSIFKSNLLNFQLSCPIEGIFIYNYKEELIISWCDGIYEKSNSPKVLNTTNLPFAVDANKELIDSNEFTKLEMFPNIKEATIASSYLEGGNLDAESMYITYSYVFNDDSSTVYFPLNNLFYLRKKNLDNSINIDYTNKGVRLNFTDLDINFTKLKLGLIINKENTFTGYESYTFEYTGTSIEIDVTSLNGYTSKPVESVILNSSIFTKINTMTVFENTVKVGNIHYQESIKFQKYANLLQLKPVKTPYTIKDETDNFDLPNSTLIVPNNTDVTLMPDEVYAFYIELQLLNGSYTEGFHIPGSALTVDELSALTETQKTNYNLAWVDNIEDIKQFHMFNTGNMDDDVNIINTNTFGKWQNANETYPNTDEYNSTIDYNGNPIVGGTDLRNNNIRYHRMPEYNEVTPENDDQFGYPYIYNTLGVRVVNFGDICPEEIKNQIQGYRLSFVQRETGNTYVLGNWDLLRRRVQSDGYDGINYTFEHPTTYFPDLLDSGDYPIYYDKTVVVSQELYKFRPSLTPTYIKANRTIKGEVLRSNTYKSIEVTAFGNIFAEVGKPLKYVPGNSISNNTQYLEEAIFMDLPNNYFPVTNVSELQDNRYLNITAFSYNKDVYKGFKSNKLVPLGRTSDLGNNVNFRGGDIFYNPLTYWYHTVSLLNNDINIFHKLLVDFGALSPLNQSYINSYKDKGDGVLNNSVIIASTDDPVETEYFGILTGEVTVEAKEGLSAILNISSNITSNFYTNKITKFPYRIQSSIAIPNEALTIDSLRTYLLEDYYEMPNTKGEIIALRSSDSILFIQHRFSLFIAFVKDKLQTDNIDAYLGRGELFDRVPKEILNDSKGYIGSVSKFACQVIKDMYITVNQVNGQIFIIKGNTAVEITNKGNKNWFWDNWDNGLDFYYIGENGEKRRIDNPFISVGHLVGYDKQYDRLLFTKKLYEFKFPELIGEAVEDGVVNFDGEFYSMNGTLLEFTDEDNFINKSQTLSFNISSENWSWVSPHDYFPNLIFYTSNGLYSITNKLTGTNKASVYRHNDKSTKGLFYGQKFSSYVDLIFNSNLEISKLLMNVSWITDVINNNGGNENFKTITHIAIYNENQCSGIINLKDNHYKLTRNVEGDWNCNDFRDLVINPNNPILMDNGDINTTNINNVKLWFDKSNFISKFITVRLLIDNIDNDTVYIHEVKTSSLISKK